MKKYIVKIAIHKPNPAITPRNSTPNIAYAITAHKDFHLQDHDVHFVTEDIEKIKRKFIAKAAQLDADVEFILADEA